MQSVAVGSVFTAMFKELGDPVENGIIQLILDSWSAESKILQDLGAFLCMPRIWRARNWQFFIQNNFLIIECNFTSKVSDRSGYP